MFALARSTLKISHVNIRQEKRGVDDVNAIDLKIEGAFPQSILDAIAPDLLDSIYEAADGGDDHAGVGPDADEIGVSADANMPQLRDLRIAWPIGIEFEGIGYTLEVQRGIGSPMQFGGVKVNKIKVEPLEGGTVNLTLRAQISPIEAEDVGRLSAMLNRQTEIALIAPTAADLAQLGIGDDADDDADE